MKVHLANAIRNGLPIVNEDLHKKCNSEAYHLELSQYKYRKPDSAIYSSETNYDILLCLFYNGKCISSVSGNYDATKHQMEIVSKTNQEHEGKKFNLYLRAAFIYLMCFVRPSVKTIMSYSVNPISTYTMYKYFHASNKDLDEFLLTKNLDPDSFTVSHADQFHKYISNKYKHTPETAKESIEEMLQEGYTMEELGWDSMEEAVEFIMKTTKLDDVIVISLRLDIQTPEIQEYLLQTLSGIQMKCDNTTPTDQNVSTKRKRNQTNKREEPKKKNRTRRTP